MQEVLIHEYVTVEHLLFSILCRELVNLLKGYGADVDYVKQTQNTFENRL